MIPLRDGVDGHLQEVALNYGDDSAPCVSAIPAPLCQTSVRLHHDDLKQLAVHLYWTNGKILVQGRKCRSWMQDEFSSLALFISSYVTMKKVCSF